MTDLLPVMLKAALAAGQVIDTVYARPFTAEHKADGSPVTEADAAAEKVILDILAPTGIPVLAEESASAGRIPHLGRRFFVVDPLDGTKEFIKRNGEFTVNIALVDGCKATLGVMYVPVTDTLYWGLTGKGAYKEAHGQLASIHTSPAQLSDAGLQVVASRSHRDPETEAYLAALNQPQVVSMGSALKFMLLAEGKAHLYPRFAPTMEWDTAAAQVILEAAGGSIHQMPADTPMVYNKPELVNPFFIAKSWVSP